MAYFYFSSFSHEVLVLMNMQKHFLFFFKKRYHLKIWMCACRYKLHGIFYKRSFYCCDQIPDEGWFPWRNHFLMWFMDFKDCMWITMNVEVGAWSLLDGSVSKGEWILCSAASFLVSVMFNPGPEPTEWFKCPSGWIFYHHGHLRWAIQACPEGCLLGDSEPSRLTLLYNQLTLHNKMC